MTRRGSSGYVNLKEDGKEADRLDLRMLQLCRQGHVRLGCQQ
jgi:hypothetical protein